MPAIALSLAVHAGALAIAPRIGAQMIEPVVDAPVIALRFIEPIAPPAPVVEVPLRTEHVRPEPQPIKGVQVPARPREQPSQPVAAVAVTPTPSEHADDPVLRSAPVTEAPPAAVPMVAIADEVAPIPAEKPREVIAAGTKASSEATQVAVQGDSRVKLPHYNVAYLNNPPPAYPAAARRMRLEGLAVVRALISVEGKVETMKLEKTSGSDLLDDAAQRAVKSWRFVPARLGTETVAHWVDIPIQFRLSD
ncbi:MAG: energy transducer TonB [Burkholderiales bacterium]